MSSECDKYKGLKKRLCEGWKPADDGNGWRRLSDNERERFMASFKGQPVPKRDRAAVKNLVATRVITDGPGTELEKLFSNFSFTTCGECARLKSDMNTWGPDTCQENRDVIIRRLESNAKRRPVMKRAFSKTAAGMFVDQAIRNSRLVAQGRGAPEGIVSNLVGMIGSAFKKKTSAVDHKALTWSYGVTTVPERIDSHLPRTLKSLKDGGFDSPYLFIDKCTNFSDYEKFGLPCTFHSSNIKAYGNWMTALWELFTSSPLADRYAIFQDDFVTYRNLRQYLECCKWPGKGYLNLFTFPQNHALVESDASGWHVANQRGLGAVALVFNHETARTLLTHNHMVVRTQNKDRGHKFIDGGVVDTCASLGWKEYIHHPSLVQHTGAVSSIGTAKHPLSPSFMGEEFDAMELAKKD